MQRPLNSKRILRFFLKVIQSSRYNFATAIETPGRALVDTAAQHGLIGQETLSKLDQHLANQFGMRIKHTNEDGGAVRGGSAGRRSAHRSPMSRLGSEVVLVFSEFRLYLVQCHVCFLLTS